MGIRLQSTGHSAHLGGVLLDIGCETGKANCEVSSYPSLQIRDKHRQEKTSPEGKGAHEDPIVRVSSQMNVSPIGADCLDQTSFGTGIGFQQGQMLHRQLRQASGIFAV